MQFHSENLIIFVQIFYAFQETKEESGPGAGAESEADLVAKDDNQDQSEAESKDKQQPQPQEEGEMEEPEINEGMDEVGGRVMEQLPADSEITVWC